MKKALILDGSAASDEAAGKARESLESLLRAAGWTVETLTLREKKIAGCTGCFGCWLKTPGTCVIPDDGREAAEKYVRSDLAVFLTPVIFGGYSYDLKKALDRMLPNILPYFGMFSGELHHTKRYDRYPTIVSIGTLKAKDSEAERIFGALLARQALSFISPTTFSGTVLQDQSTEEINARVKQLLEQSGVPA